MCEHPVKVACCQRKLEVGGGGLLRFYDGVGGGAMSDPIFEVETEVPELEGPALVDVTDAARDVVLGARAQENDPEHLALWIEVIGASCERLQLRHLLPGSRRRRTTKTTFTRWES